MTWLLTVVLFVLNLVLTDFSLLSRIIFKCSCETIFKKKQLLFQHFHQNASKRVTCVFKCPECNSVFPQKQLLMEHFKVCMLSFTLGMYVMMSGRRASLSYTATICCVFQGVHIGTVAEEERKHSDKTGCCQDAHSVQPHQKTHGRVKHNESPGKKAEHRSRPRVQPPGWTCGECVQWFPERESYVSHVKTQHGKVRDHTCTLLK